MEDIRVSVITPTLNSVRTLDQCLVSIRSQDFPQDRVEILIVDGGSTDGTCELAERHGATVLSRPDLREDPEARKSIGLHAASGAIVCFIDSDNILPHSGWLTALLIPFEDPTIVGSQPFRYAHRREDSPLNRYFALFGVNDPVPYFLNKRDRWSWKEDTWRLLGSAEDRGQYFKVRFVPDHLPTIGANGFLCRKDILLQSQCDPERFFHIDVHCDQVSMGHDTYAFVKEDIIHLTGQTFVSFLKKRLVYMDQYYVKDMSARRYIMVTPADRAKMILFILYSLTLFWPLAESLRGYGRVRDFAWFLHPAVCLGSCLAYGGAVLRWQVQKRMCSSQKG